MKRKAITLLLGSTEDEFTVHLSEALNERGRRWRIVDEVTCMSSASVTFERQGTRISGQLVIDEEVIPIDHIAGVSARLWRSWWPGPEYDRQDQMFIYHETTAAWFNLLAFLKCPVINRHPLAWWLHDLNHPHVLSQSLAMALDIPLEPPTDSPVYTVRLMPSVRPTDESGTSIYLAGDRVLPASTLHKAAAEWLRRREEPLARWRRQHDLGLCRVDLSSERKPVLHAVEPFPAFHEESPKTTRAVAAAIAQLFP